MQKILFLCTGNSCRSQIAEGWCRHLWQNRFDCYSAGTEKSRVNPYAIQVMQEKNIDITKQFSKTLEDLPGVKFDLVFTLCGDAHEHCPILPGAKIKHVGFSDPYVLAKGLGETESLPIFRQTRDEIFKFVQSLESHL